MVSLGLLPYQRQTEQVSNIGFRLQNCNKTGQFLTYLPKHPQSSPSHENETNTNVS